MKDIREIKDYQIVLLGIIIAIGAIVSTFIFAHAMVSYQKLQNQALSVTGSASKEIKSDIAVWKAYYEVRSKDLKSGYTNLSIHEVYNKKSRTIGHMELTVMGASLRADSFKLAYLKQLPIDDIVENIDSTATYSFTSDHPELFELNDSGVISTTTGNTVQTSNITLTETTPDGIKRVLGTFKVELTNEPFISASDQSITCLLYTSPSPRDRG